MASDISNEERAVAKIARRRFLYGESGKLRGESHPRADLSDHEVGLMMELFDQGFTRQWLAEKFECPYTTVTSIVRGRTRSVTIARVEIK